MLLLTLFYFLAQIHFFAVKASGLSSWNAFYEGFGQEVEQVQHQLQKAIDTDPSMYHEKLSDSNKTVEHIKSILYMLRPALFGVKLHIYPEEDKSAVVAFLNTTKLLLKAFDKHPNENKTLEGFLVDFCPMFLDSMEDLWNNTNWESASYIDDEIGSACRDVKELCKWTKPKNDTQVPIYFGFGINETKLAEKTQLKSLAETITVLSKIHNQAIIHRQYGVIAQFDDFLAETLTYAMPVMFSLKKSYGESHFMYQLAKQVPKYIMDGWASIEDHVKPMVLGGKTHEAWLVAQQHCKSNNNFEVDPELSAAVVSVCAGSNFRHFKVNERMPFNLTMVYENFEETIKLIDNGLLYNVKKNFTNEGSGVLDEEIDNIMAGVINSMVVSIKEHQYMKEAHVGYKPIPPTIQEVPGVYHKLIQFMEDVILADSAVKHGILQKAIHTVQTCVEFKSFYDLVKMNPSDPFWTDVGPYSFIFKELQNMELFVNKVVKMV